VEDAAIGCSSFALLLVLLYGAWVRADTESRERGAFVEEMTRGSSRLCAKRFEKAKLKTGRSK
jgi:hypothetical protein